MSAAPAAWPEAPDAGWLDTCATLHMWAQIVGKVRLARAPMLNHWWQATLYVTARGLTTGVIPDGARGFQIDFDLLAHRLLITTSDGGSEAMTLASRPLPDFYAEFFARLRTLGIDVAILAAAGRAAGRHPLHRGYASLRLQPGRSREPPRRAAGGGICRSPASATISSASAARCISSGEALISP